MLLSSRDNSVLGETPDDEIWVPPKILPDGEGFTASSPFSKRVCIPSFDTGQCCSYSGVPLGSGSNGSQRRIAPLSPNGFASGASQPQTVGPTLIYSGSNSTVLSCTYAQLNAGLCFGADLTQVSDTTFSFETSSYLTEAQAARYLNVSLSTMRRWRSAATGPRYFRVGDILRYHVSDLQQFVSSNLRGEVA